MNVRTEVETIENLAEHATIPVAFVVERVLEVHEVDGGLGGFGLKDVPASPPWTKDYDAIRGEGPTRWFQRFDTSDWGLVAAYDGATRIGGAVIAPAAMPSLRSKSRATLSTTAGQLLDDLRGFARFIRTGRRRYEDHLRRKALPFLEFERPVIERGR